MRITRRNLFLATYWILITLVILYDRRFLAQKIGLGHFIECTAVRAGLLILLAYLNLNVLIPQFLEQNKKMLYIILLTLAIAIYIFLQQSYDVYLYGFVLGDEGHQSVRMASAYLVFTTIWYLLLTFVFHRALDWYEQKESVRKLEEEIRLLKVQLLDLHSADVSPSEIFLKSGTKRIRVGIDAITHIEGLKDYSIVFTDDEKVIIKGSLKSVQDFFPSGMFIRVHKSYLVATNKIRTIERDKIVFKKHAIPIGRTYKSELEKYGSVDWMKH